MASTRGRGKRNRKRRRLHEAEERFGADESIVVHTFDNGWTINRLENLNDIWREGFLMRNCLADDEDIDGTVHSLRDAVNYPHLTILHDTVTGATHSEPAKLPGTTLTARIAAGAHGTVKPEYQDLVREWLDTLPYTAELVLDRAPIFDATSDIALDDLYGDLAAALDDVPHSDGREDLLGTVVSYRGFVETFATRTVSGGVYVLRTQPEIAETLEALSSQTGMTYLAVPANPWGADRNELILLLKCTEVAHAVGAFPPQLQTISEALEGIGNGPWVLVPDERARILREALPSPTALAGHPVAA